MVPETTVNFVERLTDAIVNPILGLLFALALVYFLAGLLRLIMNPGDTTAMTEGKQHMIWGLIGMSIMVSVYGLLQLGLNTFGVSGDDLPDPINIVD